MPRKVILKTAKATVNYVSKKIKNAKSAKLANSDRTKVNPLFKKERKDALNEIQTQHSRMQQRKISPETFNKSFDSISEKYGKIKELGKKATRVTKPKRKMTNVEFLEKALKNQPKRKMTNVEFLEKALKNQPKQKSSWLSEENIKNLKKN